jgi:hypothetical protein
MTINDSIGSLPGNTSSFEFAIEHLFDTGENLATPALSGLGMRRDIYSITSSECIVDSFAEDSAQCAFLRVPANLANIVTFSLDGSYAIQSSAAGGWLLKCADTSRPAYWLPRLPIIRQLDDDKHVLKEIPAEIVAVNASLTHFEVTIKTPAEGVLDIVIWYFAPESSITADFDNWLTLETQAYFTWSSHTLYQQLSDVFQHLLHGHVYENHTVWPRYWKVCSELDAYSLYVTLSGLQIATGKRFYKLLQNQIVQSVIARQNENGGWNHGEWTGGMESHYRLCAAALHLLVTAYQKDKDVGVQEAMQKAATFLTERTDQLEHGVWFLHDSLETNLETMKAFPFRWIPSRALGKSANNMLVLNTHLDTTLALDRYSSVSGDRQYTSMVQSAHISTQEVLGLRPAEWLYKLLFRAINLTLLPTPKASQLPLPVRALKRFAWKHLIPWLPKVKARFPRLIMPGGHIERDLSQCSFADQYQSVTLMDLFRYARRFPNVKLPDFSESLNFTHASGLRDKWKESRDKDHALGFWTEALHHLCMQRPDSIYRHWLLAAVFDTESHGTGLSPSVMGAHPEINTSSEAVPCPSPTHKELRVINLSRHEHLELLVINPSNHELPLIWQGEPVFHDLIWHRLENDAAILAELPLLLPPKTGLWGHPRTT